jgi:hypothetical protein
MSLHVTKVQGLVLRDGRIGPPEPDGWEGVGVLLEDLARDFHGVLYWVLEGAGGHFIHYLTIYGIDYEIRDEVTDIYVLSRSKGGRERLRQTREFIRPRDYGEFVPVAKRIEFGKSRPKEGFSTKSIPARTVTKEK